MICLVMQFGNVEAEIEFFASLVKADGWLKGDRQQELEEVEISDWTTTDNHIRTCFADNKRKKEQVGWKIRNSLLNVVNGKVPACGMDWQNPRLVVSWPIERVDVPQQSNQGDCGMFVLKYIELLSAELPLATCTSQNMPFFRLKLAAEITRGDAYMP
ncbi:hypothetical protein Prudu_263S001200 [Prunus dulcis]|uniref:Ubiquitin-like protease family profile domain-containing protein n=1 Tax=Prunus dulcis TaxID=3755 RepID=A0A5H2XLG1_PRUDU|nr:hypothetical protein Prudu_263S001200 [Prunus dulcis]